MSTTSLARQLRRNATDAETALWRIFRTLSAKFRRQQPIGPYIVDFVCFEYRLVIECDGGQHADNPADILRDGWLAERGLRTLRFWNHEILNNREGVLQTILEALPHTLPSTPTPLPPHPAPLPRGQRE